MALLIDLTGQKFGHWTVLEELKGGKVKCQCDCEAKTVKILYKKAVKEGKTKSCGCDKGRLREDFTGQVFGRWHVDKELGGGNVLCTCQCPKHTQRIVRKQTLKSGDSKSCGCLLHDKVELKLKVGDRIGEWEIIESTNNLKCTARCSCGKVKELYVENLTRGYSKSCGHVSIAKNYIIGKKFGEWTVLSKVSTGRYLCKCSCGTERIVYGHVLRYGRSKSCGCKGSENIVKTVNERYKEYIGKTIGSWTILEVTQGCFICECVCGEIRAVSRPTLLKGLSRSCGCQQHKLQQQTLLERYGDNIGCRAKNPRTAWQMETAQSKEKLEEYLSSIGHRVRVSDLSKALGVSDCHVGRLVKQYDLSKYIDRYPDVSSLENTVCTWLDEYGIEYITNDRSILGDLELDIFIPSKNLAIELNGSYWHSTIFKDSEYHLYKTERCQVLGIELMHIFEYELLDDTKVDILKSMLCNRLGLNEHRIYARDTEVIEIDNRTAKIFLEANHLQGGCNADVNIALTYNNEMVAVMTFSQSRFDKDYEYEIVRACSLTGLSVAGGYSKMLKHFIREHSPKSIMTYSDRAKFSTSTYEKIGMEFIGYTSPGYVWCNKDEVLSRYKTTKSALTKDHPELSDMTEDEIMYGSGFYKIYNCGNAKYAWRADKGAIR